MSEFRLDLTSSVINGPDWEEQLERFRATAKECGLSLGLQLHNTITSEAFERAKKSGLPLSFHAPLFPEHMINLASDQTAEFGLDVLKANDELLAECNGDMAVFHGFGMNDVLLPGIHCSTDYYRVWQLIYREDLSIAPGTVQNREFRHTEEFQRRRERLRANLAKLRERVRHTFCIENDLPVYGNGLFRAEDMLFLDHPLCLDSGHMWTTSLLYGFDYLAEMKRILDSGRVKMAHLHDSLMNVNTPLDKLADGHQNLGTGFIPLAEVISLLCAAEVPLIVLEITRCTSDDITFFSRKRK